MSPGVGVPPPVSWAQRSDLLFVIINVECKDVEYKFTEDSMYFRGTSVVENKLHEVTLNFLKKINPDKVSSKNIARCLEFTIFKADSGPYWSTLTKDKKKPPFLKVDFNKWRDEGSDMEEGGGEAYPNNMYNYFKGMVNEGDSKPSFDDFDDDQEDSDDENIPQLSSEKESEKDEKEEKQN